MGSNLNFKNFGNDPPVGSGGGRLPPPSNSPLTRQSSVYSLTFEEFQNTVGGSGKDFGSMNMDELLKSIWSAEDIQNFGSTSGGGAAPAAATQEGGSLQRQGSLILPRTISQKTVDEVWRDMSKEANGGKDVNNGVSTFGVPHRQSTLNEITLEEFLVRAGVVREDSQLGSNMNNAGFFGDLWHPANVGLMGGGGGIPESSNQISVQSAATLPLNVNGVHLENQQQQQRQHQQILPKQTASSYGSPLGSGPLGSPRIRVTDPVTVQGGALGMVGLGTNGSPAVSSDRLSKSNGDMASVSPVPYVFNGGLRGRKNAAFEKVVERRQRRMIKNRESAARSRARKQAYTMELEAEVQKLKEENEQLLKKQEEMMEVQKNQVLEMMKQQNGTKRRCLRRTQTGPW